MTDEVVAYEGEVWLIEPAEEGTYVCESEGCEAYADWYLTAGDAHKYLCEWCVYPVGTDND